MKQIHFPGRASLPMRSLSFLSPGEIKLLFVYTIFFFSMPKYLDVEHCLSDKHCNKLLIYTSHLIPMTTSSAGVITDICSWGNWSLERLSDFPQITQLGNGKDAIWDSRALLLIVVCQTIKRTHIWVPSSFLKVRTASDSLYFACSSHSL